MEKQKNIKKTVSRIVPIAIGILVYFLVKQFVFAPPTFDKAMMQAASEVNKSCPIMIDQETRLDNVVALPNNIFQYNYTLINWVKDSIDLEAFEEQMQPVILNSVKTNPDMKLYRDNKTTMAYNYKDMNGVFIMKISITADLYLDKE